MYMSTAGQLFSLLCCQVTAEATEKLQKGGPSKQYTISTLGHSVSSPLPQGVHEVDKSELYLPVDDIVPKSVPHLLPRQVMSNHHHM